MGHETRKGAIERKGSAEEEREREKRTKVTGRIKTDKSCELGRA